ncbi:MAG: hypothetical protein JJU00_20380 [Opitutales bacterium]|nr:hypothetical protein [Opitutales bacterium]
MKTIREGDLIFDVSSAVACERFDDNKIHGSKSTMKRIDFIIEEEERFIFLEVKDPDKPGASNPQKFHNDFRTGDFIPEVARQCRDTLLFTKLRRDNDKPISYVVLVCMQALDEALLLAKTDELISALPVKNKSWANDSVGSCVILKLDAYKRMFGDGSVWRASDIERS